MRKILSCVACVATVVCALATASSVQARPDYLKGFNGSYPALKEAAEGAKCAICHFGEKKSNRNDYGKAVGTALGAPKVTDAEKINAALKMVEAEKSSTDGKTFGELIKDGKLPGKAP